eukprot:Seg94.5 transcript_id=Seg94.5/GoldUCD/mRNA.D3Y31 product="hypothetical protein" protein_id=Seg94.5/GoldUCD/D3Y31
MKTGLLLLAIIGICLQNKFAESFRSGYRYHQSRNCRDVYPYYSCLTYRSRGYCYSRQRWMNANCRRTCSKCPIIVLNSCRDKNSYCHDWARRGECYKNPGYMRLNCRKSCGICRM